MRKPAGPYEIHVHGLKIMLVREPGVRLSERPSLRTPAEAARVMETMQVSTDHSTRKAAFRRMLEICEREDPCYSILHQNATFTAKRKDLPWRAAQSFVMDFSRRNWGA